MDTEGLRANGIFYAGTSGICHNISAPLRAIVLLGQKPDNILRPASGTEAFGALLHQCAYYPWDGAMTAKAMELVANLVQGVQVYRLECRPEEEAVRLVERELFGRQYGE